LPVDVAIKRSSTWSRSNIGVAATSKWTAADQALERQGEWSGSVDWDKSSSLLPENLRK
jgi:hypothetical protein